MANGAPELLAITAELVTHMHLEPTRPPPHSLQVDIISGMISGRIMSVTSTSSRISGFTSIGGRVRGFTSPTRWLHCLRQLRFSFSSAPGRCRRRPCHGECARLG